MQHSPAGGAAAAAGVDLREGLGLDRFGPLYHATQYPGQAQASPEQGPFASVFPTTTGPPTFPQIQASATPHAVTLNWQPTDSLYGVPHTALQDDGSQPGFDVHPWLRPGDSSVSLSTPDTGTLPLPAIRDFEMLAVAPEDAFSDSDPAAYGGRTAEGWQQHQPQPNIVQQEIHIPTPSTRQKRTKKPLPSPVTTSSKTMPASAGTRDRKPRTSHNTIEKQYRDRLNTQFDILMNTLPAAMSGAGGGGGGDSDGNGNGNGGGGGSGERRLSKAQVLDLSARYIRALEGERDGLVEEREVLRESVRKLKERCEAEGVVEGDGEGG